MRIRAALLKIVRTRRCADRVVHLRYNVPRTARRRTTPGALETRVGTKSRGLSARRDCQIRADRGIITELEQLTKVRYVCSYHAATIYANLGEEEAAMRCLDGEARQRSGYLAFGPLTTGWESLHRTSGFWALMERLGVARRRQCYGE